MGYVLHSRCFLPFSSWSLLSCVYWYPDSEHGWVPCIELSVRSHHRIMRRMDDASPIALKPTAADQMKRKFDRIRWSAIQPDDKIPRMLPYLLIVPQFIFFPSFVSSTPSSKPGLRTKPHPPYIFSTLKPSFWAYREKKEKLEPRFCALKVT